MNGLLNLNKPTGITSRDAVDLIVALAGKKTRVGHAGTLDPLASGVLVLGLGSGTRLIEYIQRLEKVYRTTIRLGARSDTDDADGTVIETTPAAIPTAEQVGAAVRSQIGTIAQVPPRFSAVKLQGRRAYELARHGRPVELHAREVVVHRIEILSYHWPLLKLEITCGGGTYIRSIARDVGEALGCGGLVDVLTRLRIGPFRIEDAIDPRDLTAETLSAHLRPLSDAVSTLPALRLDLDQLTRIRQGQSLAVSRLAPCPPSGELALFGPEGDLAAIALCDGTHVRPARVLGTGS